MSNTHTVSVPLEKRISAFAQLGLSLRGILKGENSGLTVNVQPVAEKFNEAIELAEQLNRWFTKPHIIDALGAHANNLTEESLNNWLSGYEISAVKPQRIGVVMAGNIPMVGFHDWMCVLLAGHICVGKLSSQDKVLLPLVAELLVAIEPEFAAFSELVEGKLENPDAVIATGSNNTSRYFEHYFGKYPNIIRKSRNSVALLNGNETEEELTLLGEDIFKYFGLGCRSVSKLFVPQDFDLDRFFSAVVDFGDLGLHTKYTNNYEYHRTLFLLNRDPLLDNGFVLLKEDTALSSPIGMVFYERYSDINEVVDKLATEKENIQCIVSKNDVPFGQAQKPGLSDFADRVDTLKFLQNL